MICKLCGKNFDIHPIIEGKRRNLCKRKYCLECSPFNTHNTKKLDDVLPPTGLKQCFICKKIMKYSEFSQRTGRPKGHSYCKKCASAESVERFRKNKQEAIDYKGGKCQKCGYNKCVEALEFHHLNPNEKDINFKRMRGWEKTRRERELDKCVLLCSNCHREEHSKK